MVDCFCLPGCFMDNRTVAENLIQHAHALEADRGNLYRVRAYRRAAQTVLALDRPLTQIVQAQGRKGLQELPGIGAHLSYTIDELVRTGEFRTWDRGGASRRAG